MSIGMIAKQPFAVLKTINDNSRDLAEMINKVKKFENVLDEAMYENQYDKLKQNDKTPLFTAQTVENMKKAKAIQDKLQKANNVYKQEQGEER